jgi:hypothetical protein
MRLWRLLTVASVATIYGFSPWFTTQRPYATGYEAVILEMQVRHVCLQRSIALIEHEGLQVDLEGCHREGDVECCQHLRLHAE